MSLKFYNIIIIGQWKITILIVGSWDFSDGTVVKNPPARTSLVAKCLRIHLPMQGTRIQSLVREDTTCHRSAKPMCHNYWACALEPERHNYWAQARRARAPLQEKPLQWEAHAPQRRVAPSCRNYRKPARSNKDPMQPKIYKLIIIKKENIIQS